MPSPTLVLGAAALGDLGEFYPSSDPRWDDADSMLILRDAVARAVAVGFRPTSADVTIIAELIRIAPHRDAIRTSLATALGIPVGATSVKATTTDSMGFLGRDEGIAAPGGGGDGRTGTRHQAPGTRQIVRQRFVSRFPFPVSREDEVFLCPSFLLP